MRKKHGNVENTVPFVSIHLAYLEEKQMYKNVVIEAVSKLLPTLVFTYMHTMPPSKTTKRSDSNSETKPFHKQG